MVCGRVPKFGSGSISLSGELILESNYFKKCLVFECLNLFGWVPAKVLPLNEIWREVFFNTLEVPAITPAKLVFYKKRKCRPTHQFPIFLNTHQIPPQCATACNTSE